MPSSDSRYAKACLTLLEAPDRLWLFDFRLFFAKPGSHICRAGFGAGKLLLVALASPALSAADPAIYPAAQCAALWLGQHDYARNAYVLRQSPDDLELAKAFRQVALRLTTQDPASIDTFIEKQRPIMAFMVEAYIYGGDRQSRDVYERLMQDCADFAGKHPETRALR